MTADAPATAGILSPDLAGLDLALFMRAALAEVVRSGATLAANAYVRRHIRSYYGGVLAAEAAAVFARYAPRDLQYIQTRRF